MPICLILKKPPEVGKMITVVLEMKRKSMQIKSFSQGHLVGRDGARNPVTSEHWVGGGMDEWEEDACIQGS